MSDLIDEVINDKKDELKMFYFKKSIPIILGLTILLIIGMVINDFRQNKARLHSIEMGDTIVKSIDSMNSDMQVAEEGLDFVLKNAKNNEKDLAALQLIAIKTSSGQIEEALAFIDDVIKQKDYLDSTKSYAKLMWLSFMIERAKLSEENISRAKDYFASYNEDSLFYGSASLLEALWYQNTDKAKSLEILGKLLSSNAVSNIVKEEAYALMSNLNIEN